MRKSEAHPKPWHIQLYHVAVIAQCLPFVWLRRNVHLIRAFTFATFACMALQPGLCDDEIFCDTAHRSHILINVPYTQTQLMLTASLPFS